MDRHYIYCNMEYVAMVQMYARADYDSHAARRLYAEPQHLESLRLRGVLNPQVPSARTIVAATQRLHDHGQFQTPTHAQGRGRSAVISPEEVATRRCHFVTYVSKDQIEDLIAKVHDYFREEYELLKLMKPAERLSHLSKISWRTARATGVSQAAVREILSKQATRTRTKRRRPPQRPDKHRQPPKKPRSARYKPKKADSSSEEDSSGGDEDDGEHSTTEHVVESLVVKEEPETYNDEPEVYVQLAGVKTEPDACGDDRELADPISVSLKTEPQNERDARELADPISVQVNTEPQSERDTTSSETVAVQSAAKRHKGSIKQRHAEAPPASCAAPSGHSSEEDSSGGDEDDGEHSTAEHVVETLVVKEEPETYNDEPEVYGQLAGVKTEPDACGDDSSDCETLAALSAAKRHKGSIKQRHAEAPPASCAAPSGQLPLPPDQQLKVENPLTNEQGFS